jgi:hypothetical protein
MKNIAITIGVKEDNEGLWINGIKLNALYLAKLLKNIGKYNVFFANTTSKDITKYSFDTKEFPVYHISEIKSDIDILISLGGQIDHEMTMFLKSKKTKIVSYKCGDEYVIRMENGVIQIMMKYGQFHKYMNIILIILNVFIKTKM